MTSLAVRREVSHLERLFNADPFPVRQGSSTPQRRRGSRLLAALTLAFCVALLWPSIGGKG